MASGFRVANAFVSLTLDRDPLKAEIAGLPADLNSEVDRAGKDVGKRLGKGIGDGADGKSVGKRVGDDVDRALQPRAEKSGKDSGDKLSQGMRLAVIRNSPMIAAAVAGGLTAGAPALLGAAGALFVGIAAVAVHSNAQIQSAFVGTKDAITSTFTNAASVTVPFFVSALGRIGSAVSALGPQLHSAFASLGGPIDSLTTGLISLINNVMPGLVAAVKSAGPVFQGLSSMLGSIGSGIGQMFQILSEHSGAAGQVFSELGQVLGALLPILGQLLGTGAELASQVLPSVVSILQGLAGALNVVAPVLPAVAAGFAGFMIVKSLLGPMDALAAKLEKLGSVGTTLGGALPEIAAGLVALTAAFSASSSQLDDWAQGLEQGGQAAATATQQLQDAHSRSILSAHSLGDAWGIVKGAFADGLAQIEGYSSAQDKATQQAQDYYNKLTPLGQAQQDVTTSQNDLQLAIEKYGPASGQAAGAAVAYRDAQQKVKDMEDQTNLAIHGVTQAMIDQADEAMAAIDSSFALQHSQNQQRDAEIALKDAIKQHGSASTQAHDAEQNYAESIYRTAEAAGKLAADQSGLKQGSLEYKQVLDSQLLASLLKVRDTLTGPARDAVDGFIKTLQDAGVTSDTTGKKLDNLGQKKPTPQVKLDDGPYRGTLGYVQSSIASLGNKKPTPTAFMNKAPFTGAANSLSAMLSYLNARHITPSASLIAYTLAAEQALNSTARNRISYVTQYVQTVSRPGYMGMMATGGKVGAVAELVGKRFDVGGKLSGPGGPTDDLIQAVTGSGTPIRVSNDEWVIKGSSSAKYGDYKMAAVNDGRAVITVPGPHPAASYATGGSPGDGGSGVSIGQLHVHVNGVVDFTIPGAADRVARPIQQAILRLERSAR